jgi:hypothetical protein
MRIPEGLERLAGPENLRRYYEFHSVSDPKRPRWFAGIRMCDRWLQLMQKSDLCQSDIDSLLRDLRLGIGSGSIWSFMLAQFEDWAKEKGFAA